ncbi:MAG: hypothetical protein SF123_20630 [Chloroflexota bacterium]|nr:hypothetical protein [Chloroflexota bacterium]
MRRMNHYHMAHGWKRGWHGNWWMPWLMVGAAVLLLKTFGFGLILLVGLGAFAFMAFGRRGEWRNWQRWAETQDWSRGWGCGNSVDDSEKEKRKNDTIDMGEKPKRDVEYV